MTPQPASPDGWDRFAGRLLLVWAGLALGVAFLATPAKFLAPSLALPVALDVGRHTFRIYNRVEIALLLVLVGFAARSPMRRPWAAALALPALVLVAETAWLLPALDARVGVILAGGRPPPSSLHIVYVAAEALKLLWLLGAGFSGRLVRHST